MKQIQKNMKSYMKWLLQILVVIILIFLSQLVNTIGTNLWISLLCVGIVYSIYTLNFDERSFSRNKKNDKIMIPIVVWILIEFIADGVYAYANHGPFFILSFREIMERAIKAGVTEELLYTYVFISLMISIAKSRKKSLTKKQLIIIVIFTAIVFGAIHIKNWSYLVSIYQGESSITIAIRIVVHVVNAFSFGLIMKAVFIKTGSLLYCMLVHTVINISRIGTALTNNSFLILMVIALGLMAYGVYLIFHIDESDVEYWWRKESTRGGRAQ